MDVFDLDGELLATWGAECWPRPGDSPLPQPFSTWFLPNSSHVAVATGGPAGPNRVLIMPYESDCQRPEVLGECRVSQSLPADDGASGHYVTMSPSGSIYLAEVGRSKIIRFVVEGAAETAPPPSAEREGELEHWLGSVRAAAVAGCVTMATTLLIEALGGATGVRRTPTLPSCIHQSDGADPSCTV